MDLDCEVEQAPRTIQPLQARIIGSLANAFYNPEEGVLCFAIHRAVTLTDCPGQAFGLLPATTHCATNAPVSGRPGIRGRYRLPFSKGLGRSTLIFVFADWYSDWTVWTRMPASSSTAADTLASLPRAGEAQLDGGLEATEDDEIGRLHGTTS